jgi:putative transposase
LIDQRALTQLLGINSFQRYQQLHRGWLEYALRSAQRGREPVWTQSLAVGRRDYVERVSLALGVAGRHKSVIEERDVYALKEPSMTYTVDFAPKMEVLSAESTVFLE